MVSRTTLRRTLTDPKIVSVLCALGGQAVLLVSTGIMARYLDAKSVAIYGICASLITILQLIAMLRIEQSLLYADNDVYVSEDIATGIGLGPIVMIIISPLITLYLWYNPDTNNVATACVVTVIVSALASSVSRLVSQVFARKDHFYLLAIVGFIRPAILGLAQMTAALGFPTTSGVLTALTLAYVIMSIFMIFVGKRAISWGNIRPSIVTSRRSIIRGKDFIIYGLTQNLVFVAGESLVPLTMSFLFTDSVYVAAYWLAARAVASPATIAADSIRSQVYRAVSKQQSGTFWYMISVSGSLLLVCLVPCGIIVFGGHRLFELAFGPEWGVAADFAVILIGSVSLNVASLPFIGALPRFGLQRAYLGAELVGLAVRSATLIFFSDQGVLWAVFASTMCYCCVLLTFLGFVAVRVWRSEFGGRT
jgi:O-antigen/teichoic acid export membrane protein